MASGPFTLGQLARAVGMSVEDVQAYLARGLLPAARRRRGRSGDLAYHREHVDRLRFIARGLRAGFSVDDVERFLDTEAFLTCADVYRVVERRLEEVRRHSGVGSPVAVALERLIALCEGTGGKQDCRILAFLADENGSPKPADQG